MLRIANPNDHARSSWRRGRTRFLTELRLRKLRFLATQRHLPSRMANFLLFLLERKRVAQVHYLPPVVTVEAVNGCNLHCPQCATGTCDPRGRQRGKASLADLKAVIDQVCRKSLQINFHYLGEPLLNKDFYAACAYAVEKGLWTAIHSNLSMRDEDLAQKVVTSRLCNLVVSCDGATQEVYEKYRVGGDVELVFRNMQDIAGYKRACGSLFPWITAQFLVFDHNWHEMEQFRERATAAGADEILFLPGCRNGTIKTGHVWAEEVFRLATLDWAPRETPPVCSELWETPILTYDGGLYPCCFCFRDEDLFTRPEQAQGRAILDYWNSPAYLAARGFFRGRSLSQQNLSRPCRHCGRTATRK